MNSSPHENASALAILSSPEIETDLVIEGELVLVPDGAAILVRPAPLQSADLVGLWLSRRSQATCRSYASDLRAFFSSFPEFDPEKHDLNAVATEFCRWPRGAKVAKLEGYKAAMMESGKAEATVNRHLSAIRSLLTLAYRLEISDCPGRGLVDGERVRAYRDTRGIAPKLVKRLLELPALLHGEGTLRALRDEVALRLLAENGLRRSTVAKLDVRDFTPHNRTLWISEKGKGTQKRAMTVSPALVDALAKYERALGEEGISRKGTDALLVNLNRDPAHYGQRLADNGLYKLVRDYGRQMKLARLAPHMLRHTVVTTLLEMGYSLRDVQKVTGHSRIETLMIYDDNREDKAGQLTDALSGLFGGKSRKSKKVFSI